ncbi:MAG TPA: glycosyltransferase, partial [Actinotalea sp.]|nr:glycosyltransferase [Actinotalea sp.]
HVRVVAVVVAWNRRDLLLANLDGLAAQTRAPEAVVVIDNASTDDSAALAARHDVVTEVVTLPTNTGGAGGFAAGIARALVTHRADAIWIMDDDTVPTPTALEALLDARDRYPGDVAVCASRADWHDGREHPMNTPRPRVDASAAQRAAAASVGCSPIRSASFVSILLDGAAVRAEGLPQAAFFLWNDDFEYTARLLRRRVGLYVPLSRVNHLTKVFGGSDADPGPRFYNEVRNKIWTFTRSRAFGPLDTALYSAATLRRWGRLLARSDDRGALLSHAWRGLRDGVRAPLPTSSVLAGSPVVDDVTAIDGTPR